MIPVVSGLSEDARKLAHEWPDHAYLLGFSHALDIKNPGSVIGKARSEFSKLCPTGDLPILLVSRSRTLADGNWLHSF